MLIGVTLKKCHLTSLYLLKFFWELSFSLSVSICLSACLFPSLSFLESKCCFITKPSNTVIKKMNQTHLMSRCSKDNLYSMDTDVVHNKINMLLKHQERDCTQLMNAC